MTNSPAVWRRWLALELRRLREANDLAQRQVGKSCGWSGAKLSYIENAQQTASPADLARLLPLYGVPEAEWAQYYRACERARETAWWERYDPRVVPDRVTMFVGLEQGAETMRMVDTAIPGLLQTPEYAAAMFASDLGPQTSGQIARLVDIRIGRQAALTRPDSPLELSVVLDEAALRRPAGGAGVMAAQLDHLSKVAESPTVSLCVVPFARGVSTLLRCPFSILTFPAATDPGVVHIEHHSGATFLEQEHEVEQHVLVFEELRSRALPEDVSIELLGRVTEEYAHSA